MKTVTSTVADAISSSSRRIYARAKSYLSRTYFSTLAYNNPPTWANASPINGFNYPQAVTYKNGKICTAIVVSGFVYMMRHDSATAYKISTSGSVYLPCLSGMRPDFQGDDLYFVEYNTGLLKKATINWTTFTGASPAQCITSITSTGITLDMNSALHAVDPNVIYAINVSTTNGFTISRIAYSGSWTKTYCDKMLVFPDIRVTDKRYARDSAAANLGSGISADGIIYITSPADGRVWGFKYNATSAQWSDPFVALQSDLSICRVVNATYYNGNIIVTGQLARTGDEIKHDPVPLLLKGMDGGRTLSTDQFSLLSSLSYRFVTYIDTSTHTLYASDTNRCASVLVGKSLEGQSSSIVTSISENDIVSCELSSQLDSSVASLTIRSGNEAYYNDPNIVPGSTLIVDVGYQGASSILWTEYNRYIITSSVKGYKDGERHHKIDAMHEGLWRMSTQVPPYYTEILGKSGIHDDLTDLGNMYPVSAANIVDTKIAIDLWDAEYEYYSTYTPINIIDQGGVGIYTSTSASHSYVFNTPDLHDKLGCQDYPFATGTTVTLSIYGWARTEDSDDVAETIDAHVVIEHNGVEQSVATTLTSTYAKWPVVDYSAKSGSYPITRTINGIQSGDKIKKIYIIATNSTQTYGCSWCIERLELSGNVKAVYEESTEKAWKLQPPTGDIPGGIKMPGYGQHIMLSSKPYSTFGSIVTAKFYLEDFANAPVSPSFTSFGLVACAKDGNNYIAGRYVIQTKKWQIVQVADGVETLLAESAGTTDPTNVMILKFIHRNDYFALYYGRPPYALTLGVEYNWAYSYRVIAPGGYEASHVGIYGCKKPISFRTSGYDMNSADCIPILVGEDLSGFNSMGSSGKVVIDGVEYTYTGKTPTSEAQVGPYQTRTAGKKNSYTSYDEDWTYPAGVYIDTRYYAPQDDSDNYDRYTGYALGMDHGHAYLVSQSDWKPFTQSGSTKTLLRSRSSHTGSTMREYCVSLSNRAYLTYGLTGVNCYQTLQHHEFGSRVYQYSPEQIYCDYFSAFSIEPELTIKDIIKVIAGSSGSTVSFSGDWTDDSLAMSANTDYTIG